MQLFQGLTMDENRIANEILALTPIPTADIADPVTNTNLRSMFPHTAQGYYSYRVVMQSLSDHLRLGLPSATNPVPAIDFRDDVPEGYQPTAIGDSAPKASRKEHLALSKGHEYCILCGHDIHDENDPKWHGVPPRHYHFQYDVIYHPDRMLKSEYDPTTDTYMKVKLYGQRGPTSSMSLEPRSTPRDAQLCHYCWLNLGGIDATVPGDIDYLAAFTKAFLSMCGLPTSSYEDSIFMYVRNNFNLHAIPMVYRGAYASPADDPVHGTMIRKLAIVLTNKYYGPDAEMEIDIPIPRWRDFDIQLINAWAARYHTWGWV